MRELVVGMPTRNGMSVTLTSLTLFTVAGMLKRPVVLTVAEAGNIPRSRNMVMQHVRAKYPERERAWILWVDSDIYVPSDCAKDIASAIEIAERTRKSWVANYRQSDGANVLIKERSLYGAEHYTDEELLALPDFSEIPMAGFGFSYVNTPLGYMFHADEAGEDVHFALDNPEVRFHFARNVKAIHKKQVDLHGPATWLYEVPV